MNRISCAVRNLCILREKVQNLTAVQRFFPETTMNGIISKMKNGIAGEPPAQYKMPRPMYNTLGRGI